MTLQTGRLRTMEQVRAFVAGCESVDYKPEDRACAHAFVRRTLVRFDSARLGRARGCVWASIGKVCGFSPARITRLVRQRAGTGAVEDRRARNSGRAFGRVCTPADVRLLAEVDEAFGALSGLATCELPRFRGGRLCAARSRSAGTGVSSGCRGCRARTCTTCARRAPAG